MNELNPLLPARCHAYSKGVTSNLKLNIKSKMNKTETRWWHAIWPRGIQDLFVKSRMKTDKWQLPPHFFHEVSKRVSVWKPWYTSWYTSWFAQDHKQKQTTIHQPLISKLLTSTFCHRPHPSASWDPISEVLSPQSWLAMTGTGARHTKSSHHKHGRYVLAPLLLERALKRLDLPPAQHHTTQGLRRHGHPLHRTSLPGITLQWSVSLYLQTKEKNLRMWELKGQGPTGLRGPRGQKRPGGQQYQNLESRKNMKAPAVQ